MKPALQKDLRCMAGDDFCGVELSDCLSPAVRKPDLKWKVIPDDQLKTCIKANGFSPKLATTFA